jgi:hypothetical protein
LFSDAVHVEDPAKHIDRQPVDPVVLIEPGDTGHRRRRPIALHRTTQHAHVVEHHRPLPMPRPGTG